MVDRSEQPRIQLILCFPRILDRILQEGEDGYIGNSCKESIFKKLPADSPGITEIG